ncbi:D-alanyl-D-alanine carboxypeptidase family protein [Streptomyces sp. N35]|uniref:D-alanyl-D-alanine carboxypeptidase family protein n=1 Tax=Streptomyces sp. N35 TaxID=2795730 RepID=UPI0018F57733|nr:D-alanyl-D-alanine carboxypeptidase [Streptomyces sp. N35]
MTVSSTARFLLAVVIACAPGGLLLGPASAAGPKGEAKPPRAASTDPSVLYRKGIQWRPGPGVPEMPDEVSALSWLVADARTGDVLAAKNAHRKLPPASTLKTLFAVTALPHLPGPVRHKVSEADLAGVGEGSSRVGVRPGYTYRAADLWRGVFLSSGNDAVHVLARMNGGWRHTAAQMQAKARALGARDTRVVSPDGYDAPGQVSSAYDLALFGRVGLNHPEFARYAAMATAKFPLGGWAFDIYSTNRLLTGADGVAAYPGLIGIKNGYTSNAGHTLIAAAERGGRTLVVTVMNPQEGGGFAVYEEARALLDWGFGAASRIRPVGSLNQAVPRPGPGVRAAAKAESAGSTWPALGAGAGLVVLGVVVRAVRQRNRHGAGVS